MFYLGGCIRISGLIINWSGEIQRLKIAKIDEYSTIMIFILVYPNTSIYKYH